MQHFMAFRTRNIADGQLFYLDGDLIDYDTATARLRERPFRFCTIFLDRVIHDADFMIRLGPKRLEHLYSLLTPEQVTQVKTDNSIRLGSCREPTFRRDDAGKQHR